MSFCLSKWAVIYAGSMRPFVWAIIPHVIIIILRRSLIVAISLAWRSHPAGPGEDHSAKVVVATSDWWVSASSQAEESSFAPPKGTARREDAGDAAVCRRRPSCLLPVYYLFTAVLVALSSCLKWCSSQQLSGRSSARPIDGSTSPSDCCRGSDERERGWL